jgi:hypothetical protein
MRSSLSGGGPVDPEAEYFQSVEEYFVERRGDPLLLSNADWLLIRRWRRAGIPLRIVLRGIRDALDGHAHSWGRKRKVGSLRYCEREVEAARERWGRALQMGQDGELTQAAHLADLARRLREARELPAGVAVACAELAQAIEGEFAAGKESAGLEQWLQRGEQRLLQAVRKAVGSERSAELEAAIERDLAPYRERMPTRVLEQVREEALARGLLECFGLPRLSLLHAG